VLGEAVPENTMFKFVSFLLLELDERFNILCSAYFLHSGHEIQPLRAKWLSREGTTGHVVDHLTG